MRVLNLLDQKKGDMTYDVVSFSDGQKLINLTGKYSQGITNVETHVQIRSRMSWEDLQLIICAAQALREVGFKHIHLYIPYFLGARSDRKFQHGSVNYLKTVICPIINAQKFASVTVLDPHSHCLEMGIKQFKKDSNAQVVGWAFSELVRVQKCKQLVWLIPDKGAADKALETAKEVGFKGGIIQCAKHRDPETGRVTSSTISSEILFEGEDCVVVDDICDGGGTFIPLSQLAKKRGAGRVYLIVTHFIGPKDLKVLADHFDAIYCTNSVKTIESNWIKQMEVL